MSFSNVAVLIYAFQYLMKLRCVLNFQRYILYNSLKASLKPIFILEAYKFLTLDGG